MRARDARRTARITDHAYRPVCFRAPANGLDIHYLSSICYAGVSDDANSDTGFRRAADPRSYDRWVALMSMSGPQQYAGPPQPRGVYKRLAAVLHFAMRRFEARGVNSVKSGRTSTRGKCLTCSRLAVRLHTQLIATSLSKCVEWGASYRLCNDVHVLPGCMPYWERFCDPVSQA